MELEVSRRPNAFVRHVSTSAMVMCGEMRANGLLYAPLTPYSRRLDRKFVPVGR